MDGRTDLGVWMGGWMDEWSGGRLGGLLDLLILTDSIPFVYCSGSTDAIVSLSLTPE